MTVELWKELFGCLYVCIDEMKHMNLAVKALDNVGDKQTLTKEKSQKQFQSNIVLKCNSVLETNSLTRKWGKDFKGDKASLIYMWFRSVVKNCCIQYGCNAIAMQCIGLRLYGTYNIPLM